ncbi:Glycosyltransferase involved in cell wall bisynthesis [Terriglobus roseus]|uniref:Glycosyltransferase involved in cell wall bisynthesis n=2 Tax=Terriglobus roseus TaxID=392734 RepID=A0A1G7MHX2_9BACT|nr:Glycosyltransferase involved in cell wall bisynthesis [Terriglobus roseus]
MVSCMGTAPRVAFFPDSFHEVNGVAHTARNFTAYAKRHSLPMLCIRAGAPGVRGKVNLNTNGSVTEVDLPRSAFSIAMEKDLSFDPTFSRYAVTISRELDRFNPDLIHITGPSELGIFGAYFAWRRNIPLAASWHTNVHEYAGRRSAPLAKLLTDAPQWIESGALHATSRFYRLAKVLYAPNEELCTLLESKTQRTCHVMRRGVDTELFSPTRRTRHLDSDELIFGYVGRLSIEKNVALLPLLQQALDAAGINARFCIIGHGGEEAALRQALPNADFVGVLRGEALATAYANMDLFAFPSETDTFGNVVLEALASGVPAAVTDGGGPKFIVTNESTGIVRPTSEWIEGIVELTKDRERLRAMGEAARAYATGCSWDAIFDAVVAEYPRTAPAIQPMKLSAESPQR